MFISAVCTGGLCCLIIMLVSVLGTFLFLQLLLLCLEVDTLFFFWTWALLCFCHLESGFLQRTVRKTMPRDQKGASPREHRTPTWLSEFLLMFPAGSFGSCEIQSVCFYMQSFGTGSILLEYSAQSL